MKYIRKPITIFRQSKINTLDFDTSSLRFYPKHFIFQNNTEFNELSIDSLIRRLIKNKPRDLIDTLCISDLNFRELWKTIGYRVDSCYFNYRGNLVFHMSGFFILKTFDSYQLLDYDVKSNKIKNNWINHFSLEGLLDTLWKYSIY